jgi:hypothetical protein
LTPIAEENNVSPNQQEQHHDPGYFSFLHSSAGLLKAGGFVNQPLCATLTFHLAASSFKPGSDDRAI